MRSCVRGCLRRPEEDIRSPGAGVIRVVVNHLTWVLRSELGSSDREVCALTCRVIFFCFKISFCFETGSHCLALAGLEFSV